MKHKRKKDQLLFDVDAIAQSLDASYALDLEGLPNTLYSACGHSFPVTHVFREGFLKKFLFSYDSSSDLEFITEFGFLDTIDRLRAFNGCELGAKPDKLLTLLRDRCLYDRVINKARNLLTAKIEPITPLEVFNECKNGSGVTIGTKFVDTTDIGKFTYPISGTAKAVKLFEQYLEWDTQLAEAILAHNKFSLAPRYKIVRGSVYFQVPKSAKINRGCAKEATLNMFFQQGIMLALYKRMASIGLVMEHLPERHKKLARWASKHRRTATLDFKSLSDSLLIQLIEAVLPPYLFFMVDLVRSEEIQVSNTWIECPMISTMGNATTFPIETLILWALAVACNDEYSCVEREDQYSLLVEPHSLKHISVFGDDVIMPVDSTPLYIRVCEAFGMILNTNKSFSGEYPFRESCGGDYFAGHPVRPFNLTRPDGRDKNTVEAWLYASLNSLLEKHMSCFGSLSDNAEPVNLIRTVQRHINVTLSRDIKTVPDEYPESAGLHVRWLALSSKVGGSYSPILIDQNGTSLFRMISFKYLFNQADSLAWEERSAGSHQSIRLWGAYKFVRSQLLKPFWVMMGGVLPVRVKIPIPDAPTQEYFKKKEFGRWIDIQSRGCDFTTDDIKMLFVTGIVTPTVLKEENLVGGAAWPRKPKKEKPHRKYQGNPQGARKSDNRKTVKHNPKTKKSKGTPNR